VDTAAAPGKAYLQPLIPAQGMTSIDEPTNPVAEFALMSNVAGQSRSEIQRMMAPLKVVHDSSCSAAPTLELPLATTVGTLAVSGTLTVGSLSVGGSDLVARVAALEAAATTATAWARVTLEAEWQFEGGWTSACQYQKIGDWVYIRGTVGALNNPTSAMQTGTMFILPVGFPFRPVQTAMFGPGTFGFQGDIKGHVSIDATGRVTLDVPNSGALPSGARYLYLDGIMFSTHDGRFTT
jgi:hypothetical protein